MVNEEDRLRKMCAARAPGCNQWKPIIPVAESVAESEDADTAIPRADASGSGGLLLEDPEGIDARLAAAY
jgi:hypothetical protein